MSYKIAANFDGGNFYKFMLMVYASLPQVMF